MSRQKENTDKGNPGPSTPGPGQRVRQKKQALEVPVGIEKLLFLAARDEAIKSRLLADRQRAVDELKIALSPVERSILANIPDTTLESMIAAVVPENPRRRKFMGLVATAAASFAATTVINVSCGSSDGVTPDDDVDGDDNDDSSDDDSSGDDDDSGDDTDSETDTDSDTYSTAGEPLAKRTESFTDNGKSSWKR